MNNQSPTNKAPTSIPAKRRFFPGWYMVAASWVMLFLVSAGSVGIYFKPILEEFGWDRATLSLMHTVAVLFFAIALPFFGRVIDRWGPKVMLFVCVGTQTLTSVVNGLASSLWHLYVGRFLYEVKGLHATQVLINRWFAKKRGRAQGILATGMPVGMLALSPLSQFLVLTWGWRETLFFWAGVSFIILLPLTILIKEKPEDIGLVPDGEPVQSKSSTDTVSPQAEAVTAGVRLEERRFSLAFLRKRSFWLLSASHFICGTGCGFAITHFVIFATDIGYTPMIGATFLSVMGGVNLVGVLITGYMSDRIARSKVLAIVHFLRGLAFIIITLSLIMGGGKLWQLYTAMAMFGFGYFTTSPLAAGLAGDLFSHRNMGFILGVIYGLHMVGAALGAYSGGLVYEARGSYFLFFPVQGALELVAATCAFGIRMKR